MPENQSPETQTPDRTPEASTSRTRRENTRSLPIPKPEPSEQMGRAPPRTRRRVLSPEGPRVSTQSKPTMTCVSYGRDARSVRWDSQIRSDPPLRGKLYRSRNDALSHQRKVCHPSLGKLPAASDPDEQLNRSRSIYRCLTGMDQPPPTPHIRHPLPAPYPKAPTPLFSCPGPSAPG